MGGIGMSLNSEGHTHKLNITLAQNLLPLRLQTCLDHINELWCCSPIRTAAWSLHLGSMLMTSQDTTWSTRLGDTST